VNAILYVVDNGIEWWALPSDFQLWSTVYNYFAAWEAAGITQDVLDGLRDRVRLVEGRVAAPSAARRSTAEKRHIAVDTLGLLLCVLVAAASVEDRDGARPLLDQLAASCRSAPTIATSAAPISSMVSIIRNACSATQGRLLPSHSCDLHRQRRRCGPRRPGYRRPSRPTPGRARPTAPGGGTYPNLCGRARCGGSAQSDDIRSISPRCGLLRRGLSDPRYALLRF